MIQTKVPCPKCGHHMFSYEDPEEGLIYYCPRGKCDNEFVQCKAELVKKGVWYKDGFICIS